jgi:tetratricopeptide (TPR) repeat protein/transcriptional regulator with XRE-family HTH domain
MGRGDGDSPVVAGTVSGGASFGAMLRRLRGARGFTQEELAERAGLHPQEISKLERAVRQVPRTTTVEALADALRLDDLQREAFVARAGGRTPVESLPLDALPDRAPLPAGSRMPLAPNPLFVGRSADLLGIAAALTGDDGAPCRVVACTGLGGLGKTQLAVELVHRYGRHFAGGVHWLSFASADEVPLQVAACAGPELESRPLEERLHHVRSAWQSPTPRLLVFDNCEDEALLERWRPASGGCRVLVTSRRTQWSPTLGVAAAPLGLLARVDSIQLLRRYRPDLAPDDPAVAAIAHELGDLPLAIHLAGSYLRVYRAEVDLDAYLDELRSSAVVLHSSLLGAGLDDAPSPTHHVQSVAQTFALCLGRLDQARPADRVAVALLARMAGMAPGTAVPRGLLDGTLGDVDPRVRADGLRRLGAVGLAEEGDGWVRLHPLVVQFVRRQTLDRTAGAAVTRALVAAGQAAEQGQLTGAERAAVIPHLVHGATAEAWDEGHSGQLASAAGRALHRAGDLGSARQWFERALAARERELGPDHPDTAICLGDLAHLLRERGELAAARPLCERALAICERTLGPDHPVTARNLHNLAAQLHDQGELDAARLLSERALAIRERVLGPDHRDTATSLNHLAEVLKQLGDLARARPLYERALATWERIGGADHPDTAVSLNNLALLLVAAGEGAAARPLLERALAIRERVHGPDHPATALGVNNLALVLRRQGELAAARPLYDRALGICERALGPDHPHTAISLNNLARLLLEQGRPAEAQPLLERALAIDERVLGPDHPGTAHTCHNLARLAREQGDLAAARRLFGRALAIRERVLGPDHPNTVETRRAQAELVGRTGGG